GVPRAVLQEVVVPLGADVVDARRAVVVRHEDLRQPDLAQHLEPVLVGAGFEPRPGDHHAGPRLAGRVADLPRRLLLTDAGELLDDLVAVRFFGRLFDGLSDRLRLAFAAGRHAGGDDQDRGRQHGRRGYEPTAEGHGSLLVAKPGGSRVPG